MIGFIQNNPLLVFALALIAVLSLVLAIIRASGNTKKPTPEKKEEKPAPQKKDEPNKEEKPKDKPEEQKKKDDDKKKR